MNRSLILRVAVVLMILASLIPVLPARADTPFPDVDQDGFPDEMETSGWYNLSGGPFFTDPFKTDSDGDGLTDGEEKLYGTNPLDYTSPGIYVRYQDSFKTKEYFSPLNEMEQDDYGVWVRKYLPVLQGGDRYLMTDAMVVRRGTTMRIGGPISGTLGITSNGLTTLTPVANTYSGDWSLSIPTSAKVGTYTATLSVGSTFSRSMPLYVIFELPTPVTSTDPLYNLPEEAVRSFVYDDDSADKRDEVSVWWRAPEWSYYYPGYSETTPPNCSNYPNSPCSAWQYHYATGYAQAFWTEQFTQKVFVRHAIDAIQGQTTQSAAADKLLARADREFRVNYANTHNAWSTAMSKYWNGSGWTMAGGACQDNANVATTLLRSAGLPARPFIEDYNKTSGHGETGQIGSSYEYDHSVLVWLGDHWKAARSYASQELDDLYYPWDHGYASPNEIYGWYQDISADLIVTANGKWDWQNGSNGGGMVNTVWNGSQEGMPSEEFLNWNNRDYEWYSHRPLEIIQSPYIDILNYQTWYGDGWAPSEWRNYGTVMLPENSNPPGRNATQTYQLPAGVPSTAKPLENWPYNPKPTACSPSTPPDVCAAFLAAGVGMAQAAELAPSARSSVASTESPYKVFLPVVMNGSRSAPKGTVQLGEVVSDQGLDLDGDGRFEELVVQVQVTSNQAGVFRFGGWLQVGERQVRAREDQILLTEGAQIVQISFDGQEIGDQNASGPYRVINLWVAEPDQPIDKMVSADSTLDYKEFAYSTAPYKVGEFTVQAARFTDKYSHHGLDDDGDGYYESLAVYVPLNIGLPGTFQVQGDLYDSRGNLVGHADWTGSDATAALQFKIAKTQPPYTLDHLELLDSNGKLLDARFFKAYEMTDVNGPIYAGPIAFSSIPRTGGFSVMAVTATQTFASQAVDTNGNGRFDKLVFTAGVTVTDHGGDYRIEGVLADSGGNLVAWSVSDPQSLSVGNGQLTLSFDGRVIHDHLPFSPVTQTLKLMAVKIYSGNLSPATLEDQVPVAMTTEAYTRDQFDAKSVGLFEDNMERGAITNNNWTKQTPWSLNSTIWHSASNAWQGSGTNGWLTSAAVSLTDYVKPALRFDTAYQMANANQKGYLEVSTNGATWTRVATYTNSTRPWTSQYFDLSNYGGVPNLQFRFNITSTGVMKWYVDDVYLNAWPGVTGASFTYSPQPVWVQATTTFTASYTSIDTTSPVTYTWGWGDGSPLEVTHNPFVTHQFPNSVDYIVGLTVENPYDSASISQTLHANPVTDLSVAKSDLPDPVVAGNSLTYQITVTNHGPSIATDVIVTDALPSGLTLPAATSSQGSCSGTDTVTCNLGSLANGVSANITITTSVALSANRTLTNTATVAGNEYDDYTTNNAATITTTVYHAPQFTSVPVTAATQDVAYTYAIAATDADAGDILVITSPTMPTWLTLTDHGDGTATLSGTPTNADVGQHAVTLLVRDTGGLTTTQPFIIAVANVNDAPQFTSEPVLGVMQGVLYTYNVIVTDPDLIYGDLLTITAPTLPGWLTFTDHHDGTATLSGTPTNDDMGPPHAVTLQARDSAGALATQSFAITVRNVNDAPTAVNDSYSTNEDTPLVVTASGVLGNDTDPDHDPLRAILNSTTSHGTLTLDTDGSFVYTPTANYNGADSFTYRANDYIVDSDVATVSITINPVNDAPVAVDDEYLVVRNEVLSVNVPGVLSNDSDVEHSPLTAILVSGPAHGTLTLDADGSFTYMPALDYTGSDSFTYKANDGALDSNIATVTITVALNNPVPVITSLNPTTMTVSGPAFTLLVTGTNFVGNSTVYWKGSARATTFVNSRQLVAAILASDIATSGQISITVFNPAPGGGVSNVSLFTIAPGHHMIYLPVVIRRAQ